MRINKYIKTGILGLFMAIGLAGCEGSLTNLNENPNAPQKVPASLILPNAITTSMGQLYSMSGLNGYIGGLWVQQYAKIQYTEEDRYDFSGRVGLVNNLWQTFYAVTLNDLQRIIDQANAEGGDPDTDANTIAIAKILMAWSYQNMTDLWGPIPATEALKGAGSDAISSPTYDSQQVVYDYIIQLLNDASSSIITENTPFGSPDLIYRGDMNQWLKLANSLKLRVYMRMADVDATTASAGILAVFNEGNYFKSNDDNAKLSYQGNPYNNPVSNFFQGREDHKVSNTMITHLQDLNDPRLYFYAMPIESSKAYETLTTSYPDGRFPDSVYVSVINGDVNNSLPLDKASNIGHYFMAPKSPGFIMTYTEVEFILAEAALRGWIETPAAITTHYDAAVRASMEMFDQSRMDAVLNGFIGGQAYNQQDVHSEEYPSGMTEAEITAYISGPGAFPGSATQEEQMHAIALQKWIALYGQGLQSWYEWRRLDYPVLTPGPEALLDAVPKRLSYPFQEASVNETNYNAAVDMLGGTDDMLSPVWWDVK